MVWKVHTTSNYLSLYVYYDILRVYNIHIYIYMYLLSMFMEIVEIRKST